MSLYYYFQTLQSFLFLLLWLTSRPESSEAKGHAHVISNFKWPPSDLIWAWSYTHSHAQHATLSDFPLLL